MNTGFIRNDQGFLINKEVGEYEKILALREAKNKNQILERDIENLKDEISKIKELLTEVIGNNGQSSS